MTKTILADSILTERILTIDYVVFRCPYCGKSWRRGGHKEGFVKSGASNHVALCYEIVLLGLGFLLGGYAEDNAGSGRIAIPLAECVEPWHKRNLRSVKAGMRSRLKAGLRPCVPR